MNNFPKISIITPSYNQGHFIEETIQSVLDQGYPNLEYIIIDGGSADNTIEIIKKYEKYLAYWVSEKDRGQSEAINKGFKIATGDIINWLNSDDYYELGALAHVAEQFADPEITCYCGTSRIFGNGLDRVSTGTDLYVDNLAKTIGWARIDQPETFFRKSAWDEIGMINEEFHYVMDKEMWIRYLLHFGLEGIKKDNRLLVNFRIHNDSKTGSQDARFNRETLELFYSLALQTRTGVYELFEKLGEIKPKVLVGYGAINQDLLKKTLHYFFLKRALEAYAENDFTKMKTYAAVVDYTEIDTKDLKALKQVLFRAKWLPVSVKKLINRLGKVN